VDAWTRYERLWSQLIRVRWIHAGFESPEEDELLEQMDETWLLLTPEEQTRISAQPSRSLLRTDASKPARALVDVGEYEAFASANSPRRVVIDEADLEELAA
jgi:hypothetical protein